VILEHVGFLHVAYLHIKSHELKWIDLDYSYQSMTGDVYTSPKAGYNNNYEDGIIAINPDYKALLDCDLKKISDYRDHIDEINGEQLTFETDEYIVKACIDQKNISINDSTLFKKLIDIEIVGGYELYDKEECDLLFAIEHEKFWIRDKIIMKGVARRPFINNKINEIIIAQISNSAHRIIPRFEHPYKLREQRRVLQAHVDLYLSKKYNHKNITDYSIKIDQSDFIEAMRSDNID